MVPISVLVYACIGCFMLGFILSSFWGSNAHDL